MTQSDDIVEQPARHGCADATDDQTLEQGLCQFRRTAQAEQSLQAGERTHAREIGHERLRREIPAAQGDRREQGQDDEHAEDRRQDQQGRDAVGPEAGQHRLRVGEARGTETQISMHHVREPGDEAAAEHDQHGTPADHGRKVTEFLGTGYLTALARLLEALRRGRFGAFALLALGH